MSRPVTPLRVAVVRSGRKQREIAEAVGLSASHFSKIVNGLHVSDEDTRKQIAQAVGQTVEDLWPAPERAA